MVVKFNILLNWSSCSDSIKSGFIFHHSDWIWFDLHVFLWYFTDWVREPQSELNNRFYLLQYLSLGWKFYYNQFLFLLLYGFLPVWLSYRPMCLTIYSSGGRLVWFLSDTAYRHYYSLSWDPAHVTYTSCINNKYVLLLGIYVGRLECLLFITVLWPIYETDILGKAYNPYSRT